MILEKVQEIISRQLDVEKEKIQPETDLITDLGANSLDLMDLLALLEEEYKIVIPGEKIHTLGKVGDIVAFLESLESIKQYHS